MEVETYEVTEMTTEGRDSFEIEAEAQALIDEMGLEGQRKLLRQTEEGVDTKERVPYQRMNQEEVQVYSTLYPESVAVDQYDAGPIPLRVLQVASHGLKLFDEVEVWYPQTNDPDPVLVGKMKKESGYGHDEYLLARWGDALEAFADLKERAMLSLMETWTANARDLIAQCEAFIAAPEALVRKKLSGGSIYGKPWTS